MTARTSSRSAKATPKMAAEPDTNGTPTSETENESASTSGSTTWILAMHTGAVMKVEAPGGNGRATLGGAPGRGLKEARIYSNKTVKDYVATIDGVVGMWRSDVKIEEIVSPPSKSVSSKWAPAVEESTISGEQLEELARKIVDGALGESEVEVPFWRTDA